MVGEPIGKRAQHIGRYTLGILVQKLVRPLFNEKPDEQKISEFTDLFKAQMPVLERHLERNSYLAGHNFSIADVVLFSMTAAYPKTGLDFSDAPSFRKWESTVRSRDSVQSLLKAFELSWLR